MEEFRKLLLSSVFAVFTLGQEHERVHNLKMQAHISLGCKSCLHGKSKASKFDCYIVLYKVD